MICASIPNATGRLPGEERRLRMAVPKGALFDDSVTMLEAAGVDVTGLRDPGRQLIIPGRDLDFVISKPTDIPLYVAYGGADVGIAGKDVLVEAAVSVSELADLGFGGCRFVVAEPEGLEGGAEEQYRHLGVMRVATKYPRVAEEHFAQAGVQVEIVKLHGNIEVAPLIGLADRVLDITATGRTLAENRLRVVDEVFTSTARFVANPVSMRTRPEEVSDLARRLREAALELGHGGDVA